MLHHGTILITKLPEIIRSSTEEMLMGFSRNKTILEIFVTHSKENINLQTRKYL